MQEPPRYKKAWEAPADQVDYSDCAYYFPAGRLFDAAGSAARCRGFGVGRAAAYGRVRSPATGSPNRHVR